MQQTNNIRLCERGSSVDASEPIDHIATRDLLSLSFEFASSFDSVLVSSK
jgi:hypothetical protein